MIETDNYNSVRKPVASKERPATHETDGMSHTSIKAALAARTEAANAVGWATFYEGFTGG